MDDRQTNEMDSSLNNNSVNPNVNIPEEDLTSIFNTPTDENTNNLGVGETSSNYSNEIGEDTEILDLNEINAFKEAEIKIEPLDINSSIKSDEELNSESNVDISADVAEDNPFEMNNEVTTNESDVNDEVTISNVVEPVTSDLENVAGSSNEPETFNDVSNEPTPVLMDEGNTINDSTTSDNTVVSQPNVMNSINSLNPVDLDSIDTENVDNHIINDNGPGNQDFLINQDSSLVPPTLNNDTDTSHQEEPKPKKKNKIVLPLIIILILIAGVVAVYFLVFNNPKRIFSKTISKGFSYLYDNLDNVNKYDTTSGTVSLSYELTSEDENMQSVFDMVNGIDFNFAYTVDYKNKLMNFDFDSTYNNEKLLNLSVYGENGKGYVLLKDIYDKYLSTDIEGYEEIFNTTKNQTEVKTILKSAEKALNKALTNDDFIKSEETIKINGKDVKVTNNALVLNNKNFNRISKSVLTTLKNDADFISAVNKISNDESVDTKATLENAIANIGEVDPDDKTTITISIYTKGILKEFVGLNIEVKEETATVISFIKTNENTYSLVAKQDNDEVLNGTIKLDVKNDSNGGNSNVELTMDIPTMMSVKLDVKSTVKHNVEFNKVDVTNSVDAASLTEVETNTIMTNLMANPGLAKLITNIQTLTGGLITGDAALYDNDGYNYNDDYTVDNTYNNYGV